MELCSVYRVPRSVVFSMRRPQIVEAIARILPLLAVREDDVGEI
jgi:hypothetical protein